jgi:hypothetical protein
MSGSAGYVFGPAADALPQNAIKTIIGQQQARFMEISLAEERMPNRMAERSLL